jgi:DNA topoisomerase-1
VKHGKTYANLEPGDDVLTVGLNRAVTLIEEKKLKPGKGRRFGADPGKTIGEHPQKGGPIVAKNGRYGAYVSHNGINATLPGDKTPETITLDEAVVLLDARAEKGGGSSSRRKRPARSEGTPKKASPKKAAAAKAAPKIKKASAAKGARKTKASAAE